MNLIKRLIIDDSLCQNQLLKRDDISELVRNGDWRLEAKLGVEYELAYDRLYTGQWSEVPEEHRRWFQVLSCIKAYCIVRNSPGESLDELLKALYILDVAIIVNSGSEEGEVLKDFAQSLHQLIGNTWNLMKTIL